MLNEQSNTCGQVFRTFSKVRFAISQCSQWSAFAEKQKHKNTILTCNFICFSVSNKNTAQEVHKEHSGRTLSPYVDAATLLRSHGKTCAAAALTFRQAPPNRPALCLCHSHVETCGEGRRYIAECNWLCRGSTLSYQLLIALMGALLQQSRHAKGKRTACQRQSPHSEVANKSTVYTVLDWSQSNCFILDPPQQSLYPI